MMFYRSKDAIDLLRQLFDDGSTQKWKMPEIGQVALHENIARDNLRGQFERKLSFKIYL